MSSLAVGSRRCFFSLCLLAGALLDLGFSGRTLLRLPLLLIDFMITTRIPEYSRTLASIQQIELGVKVTGCCYLKTLRPIREL